MTPKQNHLGMQTFRYQVRSLPLLVQYWCNFSTPKYSCKYIWEISMTDQNNVSSVENDYPMPADGEDLYDRKRFAVKLAKYIQAIL